MKAYFGAWRCLCTSLQPTKQEITKRCEVHDRELLGPVQEVEIDETNTYGVEPKGETA